VRRKPIPETPIPGQAIPQNPERPHPLAAVPYKTLIVCQACLARLQASPTLRGRFRLKHRRLPTLGAQRPRRTKRWEIRSAQKKKNYIV